MPGRGKGGGDRRAGRGSGRGGQNQSREVTISKALSFVLRHGAQAEGIALDDGGWARVSDILAWRKLASQKVTFAEIQDVVANNNKQRFVMIRDPSLEHGSSPSPASPRNGAMPQLEHPSCYLIRASQGHSIPTISSDKLLTPLFPTDPGCPNLVVHGTHLNAWSQIERSGGLKPMSRRHVHFATGLPPKMPPLDLERQSLSKGAHSKPASVTESPELSRAVTIPSTRDQQEEEVISGMRRDCTVLIWVDFKGSMQAGVKWWKSANGVILTEGVDGKLSKEWFVWVERRGVGDVLYGDKERGLRMKDSQSPVAETTDGIAIEKLDIREGIPLVEHEPDVRAVDVEIKANWDDS